MATGPDASAALAEREKVLQLLNAAKTGNLDHFVKLGRELGAVGDVKDANKRGALHFAAREGQFEICRYLVEDLKLDVNVKDEDGETPLLHAARQGHTSIAKYLIEHGADPAIASELGATALHHSAGMGDTELLRILLSKGLDINSQSYAGTPLIWAAGQGQEDSVKVLLEHHADPNLETDDDVTPLLSAVATGSLPCLEILIKAGANVNVLAGGATPLHIAADNGDLEIINTLLQAGANPDATDEEGIKAIQAAASQGNQQAVEILLPVTTQIKGYADWSVNGIIDHAQSQTEKTQEETSTSLERAKEENGSEANAISSELTTEAKTKKSEAKARGDDAFKRKDYLAAIDAYTQAADFDPNDATLLSNRSLCWIRLGQADQALSDAKAARVLRPDWAKACYREGAALRLLQKFEEAASVFYEGVQLDPENMELVTAFRESVEAGKKFHSTGEENKEISK